ncbi:hypothetical protein HMPREF9248_0445 [Fannyhessea vaginae PB189-T1-4]|uniref:Uncharacterized protein n=1 Tax=Fannyhessea vaginae PB189-T1-4 TaxID=866774 RepID=A0ABN0B139_9ACTN|nr:hypothetical protein HMPREF9248_0445 [Fannyhessea vaginae PB189-T1-4]
MYTTCKNVQTRLGALPANWQTHAGDKPCNGACKGAKPCVSKNTHIGHA